MLPVVPLDFGGLPGSGMQGLLDLLLLGMVASLRIGAFLLAAPFFGSRMVPLPVRIVFGVALAAFVMTEAALPPVDVLTSFRLVPIVAQELPRLLGDGVAARCHLAERAAALAPRPMRAGSAPHAALADAGTSAATATISAKVPAADAASAAPVLDLQGLGLRYARPTLLEQVLGREPAAPLTVDGVDLTVGRGETVALVGESGSGKSSLLKAVAGLLPPVRGRMHLGDGEALPGGTERRSPAQLRRIQLVFQNPDDSLNPRHTVATLLAQPLQLYFGLRAEALRERSVQWLERVRLGAHYLDRLPGQMSGGEKQRVAIARAFAAEPELVLCDEVTSALDVSVQAAVLELLQTLERERGTATLIVSHDLAVVRALADRVAVLYQGRLCELGPAAAVYAAPSHPYTEVLLGAVLEPDPDHEPTLLAHDVAEAAPPQRGCPFQRRCPKRLGPVCDEQAPPWQPTAMPGHRIRCHIPVAALTPAAHPVPEIPGARIQ